MAGMNSQLHLYLDSDLMGKLRIEAEEKDISVSELIRRKLIDSPTEEEVILMRKLRKLLGGKNGI